MTKMSGTVDRKHSGYDLLLLMLGLLLLVLVPLIYLKHPPQDGLSDIAKKQGLIGRSHRNILDFKETSLEISSRHEGSSANLVSTLGSVEQTRPDASNTGGSRSAIVPSTTSLVSQNTSAEITQAVESSQNVPSNKEKPKKPNPAVRATKHSGIAKLQSS